MDIVSEINRISGAKADIRSALAAKNLVIPEDAKFSEYSGYIDRISGITGTKHDSSKSVPEGIYCSPELYALYVGLMDARLDLQSSLEAAGVTVPSGSRITDLAGIITDGYNPPIYETEYRQSATGWDDPDHTFPDRLLYPLQTGLGTSLCSALNAATSWEVYVRFFDRANSFYILSARPYSSGDNVLWVSYFHYPARVPNMSFQFKDNSGNTVVSYENDQYHGIYFVDLNYTTYLPVEFKIKFEYDQGDGCSWVRIKHRIYNGPETSWSSDVSYRVERDSSGAIDEPARIDWGGWINGMSVSGNKCYIDRCYIRADGRWLWSLTGTVFAPPDVTGV